MRVYVFYRFDMILHAYMFLRFNYFHNLDSIYKLSNQFDLCVLFKSLGCESYILKLWFQGIGINVLL